MQGTASAKHSLILRGSGTRDAIGVIRVLCEKALDHGQELDVCFVDNEKAFDKDWIKMVDILKDLVIDWRDRRLFVNCI